MIIDGKKFAEDVYARLGTQSLKLGIVVGEKNPVIDSFVRIKERAAERLGVELVRIELPAGATTEDAIAAVGQLAIATDGIIVQLPLPNSIDTDRVLASIPPEKDVDGISPSPLVRPPVAGAVAEILVQYGIDPKGKKVVVVGSGRLVGAPVAALLALHGADVEVVQKGESLEVLKSADIIVSGAGEPRIITPDLIKEGVVLIDAGTSESGGKVRGDADPQCAEKASLFTPVPGGIGPIAVAMIFKNLSTLAGI